MRFFSIGIEHRDDALKEELIKKARIREPDGLFIEESSAGDILFLNYCWDISRANMAVEEIRSKLRQYIADDLSDIIIEYLQFRIVEKIIRAEYFYFSREEKCKILQDTMAIMWGGNPTVRSEVILKRWLGIIQKRIIEHLYKNDELIMEGFIRFRMKDFIKELNESIDRAVDDLLIEKEYTEFIKLLRYFVEIQEPKVDEVHVLMEDDKKYTLLDSGYHVINNEILEDLAKEISDKEISYDDLLISSLITIAPNRITIHQYDKISNTELLDTIKNVFCGRVVMSKEGIHPGSMR